MDHVVISTRGIYAIETKTWRKPERGSPLVTFIGGVLASPALMTPPSNRHKPQLLWVERIVRDGTGKRMPVHGVLLFPGWLVEKMPAYWKRAGNPWVLAPKAFRTFFEGAYQRISVSDAALATYFLSRYIRAHENERSS